MVDSSLACEEPVQAIASLPNQPQPQVQRGIIQTGYINRIHKHPGPSISHGQNIQIHTHHPTDEGDNISQAALRTSDVAAAVRSATGPDLPIHPSPPIALA